jgi:hypothetical protein
MITFKQFIQEEHILKESFADELDQERRDLANDIKNDCGPFLKHFGDRSYLLRGFKGAPRATKKYPLFKDFAYKIPVRKDRKPLDTDPDLADAIDNFLEKKFGVRPRSEGLFCTGAEGISQAEGYGDAYLIFPIGDFKIIYSKQVADLYTAIKRNKIPSLSKFEDEEHAFPSGQKYQDVINKHIAGFDYTDEIGAALKTPNEVMVICDEYYAVPYRLRYSLPEFL